VLLASDDEGCEVNPLRLLRDVVEKRCEIPRLMDKRQQQHPIASDTVDQTMARNRHLANVWITKLRNTSTSLR
jgi:hypothetical protein